MYEYLLLYSILDFLGFLYLSKEPLHKPRNWMHGAKDVPFIKPCFASFDKVYYKSTKIVHFTFGICKLRFMDSDFGLERSR